MEGKPIKTVYVELLAPRIGVFCFWRKPDKSDKIMGRAKGPNMSDIRKEIEEITGNKKFTMEIVIDEDEGGNK